MERGNLDAYAHSIEKFMMEEEFQDYTIMDVAAAFLSREIPAETFKEIEERPKFPEVFKKKKSWPDRNYRREGERKGAKRGRRRR